MPSTFNELYVEIDGQNIIIPYITLNSIKKDFYLGTPQQNNVRWNTLIKISVSKTEINLSYSRYVKSDGTLASDITSTASMKIFYR